MAALLKSWSCFELQHAA